LKIFKYILKMVKIFLILLPLALAQVLPSDFVWGISASAYQTEGAWNVSRGPCIWDYFSKFPGRVYGGQNGSIADDFYHRYSEDIDLMTSLGISAFRLSISWSRVLPTGDPNSPSQEGVQYYINLLTALNNAGIDPWVNLYHFDMPQSFNDKSSNSTWLNPDSPNQFNAYADFCFKTFGHLVKFWLTMNEIQAFAWLGYGTGFHAPGRCSPEFDSSCQEIGGGGDSSTEPYIAAHNAILAHALAVQTYRTKYQQSQKGKIGITINSAYGAPFNSSDVNDQQAVNTATAFQYGWFGDAFVFGRYPPEMTSLITGGRLPSFNKSASALVRGSYDFLGINYYTTFYIQNTGVPGSNYGNDGRYNSTGINATGNQIGPQAASDWLYDYPQGFRGLLNWVYKRYRSANPTLYVLENGVSCPGEGDTPLPQVLNDTFRVNYIYNHVMTLLDTIVEDRIPIKGYFVWSLLDNFEWADGYHVRFGLTYVDYNNNLTRYKKESWYLFQSLIGYLGSPSNLRALKPGPQELIRSAKNLVSS
jgi:beta-glucosidase